MSQSDIQLENFGDMFFLLLFIAIPLWFVIRFNVTGILFSIFISLVLQFIENAFDADLNHDIVRQFGDLAILLVGWIPVSIYALTIYGVKRGILAYLRHRDKAIKWQRDNARKWHRDNASEKSD